METERETERPFAVALPTALIARLRLESARSMRTIKAIVAEALDARLPSEITITTRKSKRGQQKKSEAPGV